jgi:hypothetical protein
MPLLKQTSALNSNNLRRWLSSLCLLVIAWMIFAFNVQKQPLSDEYKIKAVFLYNFAQFVEWPDKAFSSGEPGLVIGVLGDDPFGPYLDETVRGEKVNEKPLIINRYQKVSDIGTCHILFVSQSTKEKQEEIVSQLKGKTVLTVSDAPNFTRRGGMIRFVNEENKIKIRINLEAAKAEGLIISSKLLRIAEIVKSQN